MEEQWLKKLKERSENFERDVPQGLWECIQHSMDEQNGAIRNAEQNEPEKSLRKIAPMVWLRRAAAVAAVLLLAVMTFVALRDDTVQLDVTNETSKVHSPVVAQSGEQKDVDEMNGDEALIAENSSIPRAGQGSVGHAETDVQSERFGKVVADTVANVVTDVVGAEGQAMLKPTEETNDNATNESNGGDKSHHSVFDNIRQKSTRDASKRDYEYRSHNRLQVEQSSKWSMNLYTSNMSGTNNSSYGYRNFTMGANPFSTMPKQETWTTGAMANIMFNNIDAVTETKVNHHLPLHVGAMVKYEITDRWGVETGLTYTLLKSDLTSGSDLDYYATEQSLHYLGIPVNVSFTVWHNDRFNVYVGAGGAMDIPLSGKTVTNYVNSGNVVDSETGDVDIDRLQWSVSAGVGVQYNIIDKLGVYVEPGVKYYFDDGSDVLTIYKDKPCNFNLQVGLRFTFK